MCVMMQQMCVSLKIFLTKRFELRFGLNWTALGREDTLKKLETSATEEERNRRLMCEAGVHRSLHFYSDSNIISKQHFNLDNNIIAKTNCHWDYNQLEEDSDTSYLTKRSYISHILQRVMDFTKNHLAAILIQPSMSPWSTCVTR